MRELDEKLIQDMEYLKESLTENLIQEISRYYRRGNLPDYSNPVHAAYYLLKYSKYYALEYYWMYDLALRVLAKEYELRNIEEAAVVYSFGCGSMVDGLSLLYAYDKLRAQGEALNIKERLYYTGVDIVRWPEIGLFLDHLNSIPDSRLRVKSYLETGMVDFLDLFSGMCGNIFMFPKILSENLDDSDEEQSIIDQFCNRIEQVSSSFRSDYIILCVSYRGSNSFRMDNPLVQRIEEAMRSIGFRDEPFDAGIYDNWVCRDYFELSDANHMVFEARENVRIDYDVNYSDFKVPYEVYHYMNKGEILVGKCRGNVSNETVRSHNNVAEICCDCGMPCKIYAQPRISINSTGGKTCFQILPFRKENTNDH